MLTATCQPTVSESPVAAQNETLPSDAEISKRVQRIRSRWTMTERIRRRHEADARFADLMDKLLGVEFAG